MAVFGIFQLLLYFKLVSMTDAFHSSLSLNGTPLMLL